MSAPCRAANRSPSHIVRQGQLEDGSWGGGNCSIPARWPHPTRHILHGRAVNEGDVVEVATECGSWVRTRFSGYRHMHFVLEVRMSGVPDEDNYGEMLVPELTLARWPRKTP